MKESELFPNATVIYRTHETPTEVRVVGSITVTVEEAREAGLAIPDHVGSYVQLFEYPSD